MKLGWAAEQVSNIYTVRIFQEHKQAAATGWRQSSKDWERQKFPDTELVEDCITLNLRCAVFIYFFIYFGMKVQNESLWSMNLKRAWTQSMVAFISK